MSSYKNDWQSPNEWTVNWVDTLTIKDLAITTTLDFQGDGLGSGDLIEEVMGKPAWGHKCVYDTGNDWVTVTHDANQFTIARYTKIGSPSIIMCFPPGVKPSACLLEEGGGLWGPATGASWTAQDGSNGICGPHSPVGSESES